MHSQPAR